MVRWFHWPANPTKPMYFLDKVAALESLQVSLWMRHILLVYVPTKPEIRIIIGFSCSKAMSPASSFSSCANCILFILPYVRPYRPFTVCVYTLCFDSIHTWSVEKRVLQKVTLLGSHGTLQTFRCVFLWTQQRTITESLPFGCSKYKTKLKNFQSLRKYPLLLVGLGTVYHLTNRAPCFFRTYLHFQTFKVPLIENFCSSIL